MSPNLQVGLAIRFDQEIPKFHTTKTVSTRISRNKFEKKNPIRIENFGDQRETRLRPVFQDFLRNFRRFIYKNVRKICVKKRYIYYILFRSRKRIDPILAPKLFGFVSRTLRVVAYRCSRSFFPSYEIQTTVTRLGEFQHMSFDRGVYYSVSCRW